MMTLDELRAEKLALEQRIEEQEREEAEREKRCDEIERELVCEYTFAPYTNGTRQMSASGFGVTISGTFPQYDYEVGACGGGSKRTFLDAVRACVEIIERETRG